MKPIHFKIIAFYVFWTLREIQTLYPSFRHNDLHAGNIAINDNFPADGYMKMGRFSVPNVGMLPMIIDYGLSNINNGVLKHPGLDNEHYVRAGILYSPSRTYDVIRFCVSMRSMIYSYAPKTGAELLTFMHHKFPPAYFSMDSNKMLSGFPRSNANFRDAPTPDTLLRSSYFAEFLTPPEGSPVNTFPKRVAGPPKALLIPKARPVAAKVSPKKPPKNLLEAVRKQKEAMLPKARPVPTVGPPVSRLLKPEVDPTKLKKTPSPKKKPVAPPKKKSPTPSPKKNTSGNAIRRRLNARKVGIIMNNKVVKFTNTSARGKACDSFKKEEVAAKAVKLGLVVDSKMSKKEICELIKKALS